MNKLSKITFSLLCSLLVVFSYSTTCTASETYSAEIVANDTELGSDFEVRIKIGKTKGILNGSFNVIYDSKKVELINAHSETAMMNGVLYALNDKYTANSVRISFAAAELFGTDGGELMVLNFKAKQVGEAIFYVEKLKLNNQISGYETTETIKSITINSISSLTEPKDIVDTVTATTSSPLNTSQAPSLSEKTTAATSTASQSAINTDTTVQSFTSLSEPVKTTKTKEETKSTTIISNNTVTPTDSQATSKSKQSIADNIMDVMDVISIICAIITGLIVLMVLTVIIVKKIKQNNN